MSDALKPLDLDSIRGPTSEAVELLKAEVKRLREALKNIRDIEEYVAGRVCTCSGVGCVHCIARLTLEGREGELFS